MEKNVNLIEEILLEAEVVAQEENRSKREDLEKEELLELFKSVLSLK